MTPKDILQSILDNGGSCDWIADHPPGKICQDCPLSKLSKYKRKYLSCYESVIGNRKIPVSEQDAQYKVAAENALIIIIINELLDLD